MVIVFLSLCPEILCHFSLAPAMHHSSLLVIATTLSMLEHVTNHGAACRQLGGYHRRERLQKIHPHRNARASELQHVIASTNP